jgi:predicted cupin superfamily sugar epimerase
MKAEARQIVAALKLEPLPREGGFFRPTWRGAGSSAILYLLTPGNFSALHRLQGDEMWHFHAGDAVELVQLDPRDGTVGVVRLGPEVLGRDCPQVLVPAGVWQGARVVAGAGAGWSLVGCTMTPAWDERNFELAVRAELLRAFPAAAVLIRSLTR